MHTPPSLLRRCGNQHSDRLGGLAVLADHLSDVALGNSEFDQRMRPILDLSHLDGIRVIDERSSDRDHEFFHVLSILGEENQRTGVLSAQRDTCSCLVGYPRAGATFDFCAEWGPGPIPSVWQNFLVRTSSAQTKNS